MEDLDRILYQATSRIPDEYFQLPVAGQENPVYRERVYCYELYHQLRSLWPQTARHSLCGEVDKSGHPLIRGNELDGAKPDFLVHIPGDMGSNAAVIEVKPVNAHRDGVEKDLKTLTAFRRLAHYRRALLLIYGETVRQFFRIKEIGLLLQSRNPATVIDLRLVELWWHASPGTPAERATWQGTGTH